MRSFRVAGCQPGPADPGVYPAPNNAGTNNGLQNNLFIARNPKAIRDNYDAKVNWNRTNSHQIFAKFSTMQANVDDLFYLGVPDVGGGNTKVYVATVGNTWTISPTMVFDGNIGMNKQNQTAQGGDFGTNFGSETFGLPGTNGPNPLQSGMPYFDPGMSTLGNNAGWTPLERHETSYTATANLTKLDGRARDPDRIRLHPLPAESLAAGARLGSAGQLQLLGQPHGQPLVTRLTCGTSTPGSSWAWIPATARASSTRS